MATRKLTNTGFGLSGANVAPMLLNPFISTIDLCFNLVFVLRWETVCWLSGGIVTTNEWTRCALLVSLNLAITIPGWWTSCSYLLKRTMVLLLLFPGWVNGSEYRDTHESFVTMALHSLELDTALKSHAEQINDEIKNVYTGNLLFICTAMDIPIPFLPVDGKDECKLFSGIMLEEMTHFDADKMALKWIEYVDGVSIWYEVRFGDLGITQESAGPCQPFAGTGE